MDNKDIQRWLRYWDAAKMVNFDQIVTQDDLKTARKFCVFMRSGVFFNVKTLAIWHSLCELKSHGWLIPTDDYIAQ